MDTKNGPRYEKELLERMLCFGTLNSGPPYFSCTGPVFL